MAKDIVFINGIVKSREKYLIGRNAFYQMADAASASEAFSMLKERGFGGEGFADAVPSDYEKMIAAEWSNYKRFLLEYAPSKTFSGCIFAKDDFFNAECAVRQRALGISDDVFTTEGYYGVALLKTAAEGKYDLVPEYLSAPMKRARELFDSGEATGAKISTVFLRAYYSYMLGAVKGAVWKDNVVFEIDCKNISTAIRYTDGKRAAEFYIGGGRLSDKDLNVISEGNDGKALDRLKSTPYGDIIRIGLEERRTSGSLSGFERQAEDLPMKKLKERRFETDGITPSLLYANYKINELKNVRVVMAMKMAGADKEEIRSRLRECYEG